MKKIDKILASTSTVNSRTVNSNKKEIHINTVNSDATLNEEIVPDKFIDDQINEVIENNNLKIEDQAQYLAYLLDDKKSIRWFTLLIGVHKFALLVQHAHYAKEMHEAGKIRVKKVIYFISILKKNNMKYRFRS